MTAHPRRDACRFRLQCAAETRPGSRSERNGDALLCQPEAGIFAVADGLSSCHDPGAASARAIDILRQQLALSMFRKNPDLMRAFDDCNRALLSERDSSGDRWQTTLVAAVFESTSLLVAHCGDSRAYLWTPEHLQQLTQDHTLVAELAQDGLLNPEQVRDHPRRNVLSSCLGLREKTRIDLIRMPLPAGAVLLLCSDGLSSVLTFEQIGHRLSSAAEVPQLARWLIDDAAAGGADDDATLVVVRSVAC